MEPMPVCEAPPRGARWMLLVCGVWLVVAQTWMLLGPGDIGSVLVSKEVSGAVELAAAVLCGWRAATLQGRERLAWACASAGIAVWTLADAYWALELVDRTRIPVPSLADVGYLALVPFWFAAIALLVRERTPAVPRTLAVDGIVAALAAGSIGVAVAMQAVLDAVGGTPLAVGTNLAYIIGDLTLFGLVLAAFAMRRWQFDRTLALLAAATVCFALSDTLYLITIARGTYDYPSPFDLGWTAATLLFAAAAWQPRPVLAVPAPRVGRMREIALPLAFGIVSLGVLVAGTFTDVHPLAVVLAAASLAGVMARLVMTYAENLRMLHASRREALTDALTGLGNRRALTLALEQGLADPAAAERSLTLVLFDLDGFKHYNDSFGHPAGDELLMRLGTQLAAALAEPDRAFRIGGDEFCVLLEDGGDVPALRIAAAADALSEHGDGFAVGATAGAVVLPREAADPAAALRIADQRMYAAKAGARLSAGRQSKDVLRRVLAERDPELDDHIADVAELAELVARRLALPAEEVELIRHAAELHDVGKVAIPDSILRKRGPLDEHEWRFVRRHTIVGEHIINGAPALGRVARLVRSSHERYDGTGYPDQLAGEEIPLGSRIVTVCDAFAAMVSERSYQPAIAPDTALRELRDGAGTQFDARVVDAFCAAWTDLRGVTPARRR